MSVFPASNHDKGDLVLKLASMDVKEYSRTELAIIIKNQLAKIGIGVQINFYEWKDFEGDDCSAIRNGRKFDLVLAAWNGGGSYPPIRWVNNTTASWNIPTLENGCPIDKSNWTGLVNKGIDEIIPKLSNGELALEQPELYHQFWRDHQVLSATELTSLPLFFVERPITISHEIYGIQPSPFSFGSVEDTWNIIQWVLNR